jgi:hypothetical protein
MKGWRSAAGSLGLVAAWMVAGGSAMAGESITLVGASIGKSWQFDRLADRVPLPGYRFAYDGTYQFDKGPVIAKVLAGADRPAAVMIKECASYFPGDLEVQRRSVSQWVGELRRAGVRPILVTTAPIAEPTRVMDRARALAKRLLGRTTAQEGLVVFNDWLREYAQRERIPLFDLEAVLRRSASDRWMRSEFDSGDRLHLNATAYAAMDRAFAEFLAAQARSAAP